MSAFGIAVLAVAILLVVAAGIVVVLWFGPIWREWRLEGRSEALIRAGRVDEAVDLAVAVGRHRRAAALLQDAGRLDRAINVLEIAGELPAAARLAASVRRYPRAAELFAAAGDLRSAATMEERGGRPDHAVRLLLDTEDVELLGSIALRGVDDVELLVQAARKLAQRRERRVAACLYRKAGRRREAGELFEELEDWGDAIAEYESGDMLEDAARVYAVQKQHRRAAYLFMKAGRWEQAARELVLDGDMVAAARILRKLGRPAAALDVLSRLGPGVHGYRAGMLMSASILEEHHRFAEAMGRVYDLLEELGYCQENREEILRLADLQLLLGDAAGAVATLERAKQGGMSGAEVDEHLMELRLAAEASLYEPPSGEEGEVRQRRKPVSSLGFPKSERYRPVRRIARGGNGILFLAHDLERGHEVAFKLLHSEVLPSDVARKYFLREARIAGSLRHPNIVRMFDCGELDGRPYLSMEYVDGRNLRELEESDDRRPNFRQKVGLCVQLCEALGYAHGRRVIHRDVKMENVMVNRWGQVKLTDFGLAKALDESSERSLFIVGTPTYMSPEQVAGWVVDHRADIYSFGVLMYRLFTGVFPYDATELAVRTWPEMPEDPRQHEPGLATALSSVIMRCLAKDPDARCRQVSEIAAVLRPLVF